MIDRKHIQIIIHFRVYYNFIAGNTEASWRTACSCKCNHIVHHWHGASCQRFSSSQWQSWYSVTFPFFFFALFCYLSHRNPSALNFHRIQARILFLFLAFFRVYLPGKNDIIHHGMLSVFIFRNLPRQENGEGKDEERWSLRGRGILLLTLVSQLNPLASAINILVMMSDEPPRGRRSGSEENELLSDDVKRERERERKSKRKKGRDE